MSSTVIHTRMSVPLKKKVDTILKKLGLTSSEAIRLYFAQIADKKSIPFSLDLEQDDHEDSYIRIKDENHLKHLIGLK